MSTFRTNASHVLRVLLTLSLAAAAAWALWRMWEHDRHDPWTRDGRVRADIVQIAPDVAGLVSEVAVTHDQRVVKGQTLFVIDRARYELALAQADAGIATAQAAIATQRAALGAHRAVLAEATREADRNNGLGSLVAREALEQSQTKVAQERAALAQAEAAVVQAETLAQQARLGRDQAALNLSRTIVKAPTDGTMSDIGLRVGDYVTPGRAALALIDSASLRVEGYFEETKLPNLQVGAPVEVRMMGEEHAMRGHITSIASAIDDRERTASASMLPNVNPTFSWVRLAQRIPVRIAIDQPNDGGRLIAGRTASVAVLQPEAGQ